MDIERVIQLLRESKKRASCPKGFKYSKKLRSCVPIKKKGKKYGYAKGGKIDIESNTKLVLKNLLPIIEKIPLKDRKKAKDYHDLNLLLRVITL